MADLESEEGIKIALRNVATGDLVQELFTDGLRPNERLNAPLVFSPDGRILAAGSKTRGPGGSTETGK